jgi:hypothetical protein
VTSDGAGVEALSVSSTASASSPIDAGRSLTTSILAFTKIPEKSALGSGVSSAGASKLSAPSCSTTAGGGSDSSMVWELLATSGAKAGDGSEEAAASASRAGSVRKLSSGRGGP